MNRKVFSNFRNYSRHIRGLGAFLSYDAIDFEYLSENEGIRAFHNREDSAAQVVKLQVDLTQPKDPAAQVKPKLSRILTLWEEWAMVKMPAYLDLTIHFKSSNLEVAPLHEWIYAYCNTHFATVVQGKKTNVYQWKAWLTKGSTFCRFTLTVSGEATTQIVNPS